MAVNVISSSSSLAVGPEKLAGAFGEKGNESKAPTRARLDIVERRAVRFLSAKRAAAEIMAKNASRCNLAHRALQEYVVRHQTWREKSTHLGARKSESRAACRERRRPIEVCAADEEMP